MTIAFLALGSNLGDPLNQVKTAFAELQAIKDTRIIKKSSLYKNPPALEVNQSDFINAVVKIETLLSAVELLDAVLAIEEKHQRVRIQKNGPRTLDIDVLLYGNDIVRLPHLEIPHPRMKERSFVIYPLLEVDPNWVLPCGTSVQKLAAEMKFPCYELME